LYPLKDFAQLVALFLEGNSLPEHVQNRSLDHIIEEQARTYEVDFAHIKGHLLPKRALALAAAGSHNVLLV